MSTSEDEEGRSGQNGGPPPAGSLQLEGRSAVDQAWYDCTVTQRGGGKLFMRFDGYGSDEEEPLRSLAQLRFSSLAAEPADCATLAPGTRVSAFKRSPESEIWVDAEVVGKKEGRHDGGKCACSFTVEWRASKDAGRRADVRISELCLLDPRPLSQHPQHATFKQQLDKAAAGGNAVPDSPEAISESEAEEEGGAAAAADVPSAVFQFRPPSGAAGPPCSLCKLPTVVQGDAVDCSDDVRREFEGLYSRNFVLHRRCIAWGDDACFKAMRQMRVNQVPPGLMTSFDGAVRSAFLTKCVMCKQTGASAQCAHKQCRKTFHLHCAKGCKLDPDLWELYCPAHGVLDAAGMSKASFYGNAKSQREQELEHMRTGRIRSAAPRLGRLRDGGTGKRSFKELHPQEEDEEPRRSTRHADKRVRYNEQYLESMPFSEGWQKDIRMPAKGGGDGRRRRGGSDEHSDAEDFMSEESDDDGSGGSRRIRYADHSSGEEDEDGIATRRGRRGKAGKGRVAARQRVLPERQRTKVKSYAEEQEELELKMEAYRAEQATKTGYENTRCEICDAKDCETCGQAAAGGGTRGRKAAAAAADLAYCSVCGGLAHEGCMQAQGDGALKCTLCLAGLADVEAVLGCRLARGADKGDERREYFVKFKEKSYRRCRWLTERATARLAPSQLQRFVRDTRDAPGVEPNVQEQWMQVDRVVATRADPATPGTRQCLVKWRGLEYDKATWEPRDEVEEEAAEALERCERRAELHVVQDAAAEERARKRGAPARMEAQPAFLGCVSWALGKLTSGMSAILGDEMGLGKTIQTAVFLQLARELKLTTGPVAVVVPLSTFGSWEREMAKYELGVEGDDYKSLKPRFHVMLTTYDVVLRDVGILKRYDWSAVVIDEGHSLKGENSLRAKTLRNLGAPWRMLLTGTPLQNNLRELLNLLAFMADATADDIEQRVNRMADPNPPAAVEGERAEEADEELLQAQAYIRKLHAYLEPRMLRRMKAICLAGQMPPKITRRVPCRMTPLQLQLYTDILAKDFDKVHAMVRNRLEKKSMNNILIRLRQACCHPYLLPGQEPEEYKDNPQLAEEAWRLMVAASGKLTLLQQLLPRLLSEGHRVLVFSQSVEMLDILEDFLHDFQDTSGLLPKAEDDDGAADGGGGDGGALRRVESDVPKEDEGAGSREESPHDAEEEEDFVRGRRGSVIRYFRLDGKSKQWQRQAMMDLFNSINCKVKVMLISTRAGSLGINLQTANTVVLYDPDFNPFVDAQAEGRAHRLGQEETVMVYQMYTASSVEERILELAAKKRKLEELVTRHLGKARDVSDEDIKSSVFYGWGNLMHQAGEDGKAGDVALSDADLARLLDREHVFADDQATGADAATLLGEVRAGAAAALQFDGGDKGAAPADGGATGLNPEMEAALLKLGVQLRGMSQDLSWDSAAAQYESVLLAAKHQW
ncbi:chromodomain-helicase-DNA-binding 3 isoform X2 [Micractinium conductrix]|uniref:Chromodomain-helicase-DNA-binding 3 isoform X2 n=1 Tax=Micractinium conductrix TaxID=554055 RepID=A0A2P6V579_9CHLO|nr:chromodomain-helicase-DNA-binding 3 isoform X2 [Micractinium conductrix]|eukprot:PSC69245.1 chromodomain-helicase-DNA-binding 3 isoform X2 [Micractinium conductrix]